jgi:hypothetical protein
MSIERILSDEAFDAAENSNNPSASNPFLTQNDLPSGGSGLASGWIAFNDVVQSSSLTYERVSAFPFGGTAVIPSLSKINALIRRNGAATSVSIRIYDVTNAQVIAEATGITTLDETAITDLGTISNLPAGEATFEIQLLRVGGTGGARAFCAGLEIRG